MQLDNQDIALILTDNTRIESNAYSHVFVESPSDFIFGIGYNRNNPSHDFRGKLLSSLIDSSKNVTVNGQTITTGGKSLLCWLKDGQTFIFREHNYLRITPADSIGFFYIGTSGIQKKTPLTNIKQFEVKKYKGNTYTGNTLTLVIGIVAGVVLVIIVYFYVNFKPPTE
jgi:hypothetical protein